MGDVSRNPWPFLLCHAVHPQTTAPACLLALEGKPEKPMADLRAEPKGRADVTNRSEHGVPMAHVSE